MQGIYIHIPFCSQACHYCDFHFSTNQSSREEMTRMLCQEITLRQNYLEKKALETVYFGGGTPSLLSAKELSSLLETLYRHFPVSPNAEITIEANPDDLTAQKLRELKQLGFNRLSIGIQSFSDAHLHYLHRIHSSADARRSVLQAQDVGFDNISVDLIYGIPSTNHDIWKFDLESAHSLNVQHISSYCLTIEPGTVFGKWLKAKKIKNTEEDFSALQFEMLMESMSDHGYEHYEVSNFSLPGLHSRHNSSYWLGGRYLGIGPAAHSYNGTSRQHNVASNAAYMQNIGKGKIPAEIEVLSQKDKVNEYLLTGIRTKWGCDFFRLRQEFGMDISSYEKIIEPYRNENYLSYENGVVQLSKKGMLIADKITSDLFWD